MMNEWWNETEQIPAYKIGVDAINEMTEAVASTRAAWVKAVSATNIVPAALLALSPTLKNAVDDD